MSADGVFSRGEFIFIRSNLKCTAPVGEEPSGFYLNAQYEQWFVLRALSKNYAGGYDTHAPQHANTERNEQSFSIITAAIHSRDSRRDSHVHFSRNPRP
jgi:hypothetical protein